MSYWNHLCSLRKIKVKRDALIIPSKDVFFDIKKTARVEVNKGVFQVGFPLPGTPSISTYSKTCISLEDGARLIINGNLFLACGVSLRLGVGATVEFSGDNFVAHNTLFLSNKRIFVGKNTGISWNCTLIDDDGHIFYKNEKKLRKFEKVLEIGDFVGIQMNVIIPSGIKIGNNSIVSAGAIIRENIPSNTLVYSKQELVKKDGYSTGFEHI